MDGADQSRTKTDRHAPDVNTAHGDRTGLHENEEQDTNNECEYEQQENDHASQSNGCKTDYGSFLNPDVLENIIETTVGRYPQMRQTLRADGFAVFQTDCRQRTSSTNLPSRASRCCRHTPV